jgi:basic membrane protein A
MDNSNTTRSKHTLRAVIAVLNIFVLLFIAIACDDPVSDETNDIYYLEDLQGLGTNHTESVKNAMADLAADNAFSFTSLPAKTYEDAVGNVANIPEGLDLIFGTSYTANKVLSDSTSEITTHKVICIDDEMSNDYVANVVLRNEEAAFFAGVIAANESSSNKVAYMGAFNNAQSLPMVCGFTAGAKTVNEEIKVTRNYNVLSYNSPSRAKQEAEKLIESGVDVIFSDCGSSVLGILEADTKNQVKIICSNSYILDHEKVVAYLQTDITQVVTNVMQIYFDGDLTETQYMYGFSDEIYKFNVERSSEETAASVEKYKIILQEFAPLIPRDEEELDEFDYEYLQSVQVDRDDFEETDEEE